MSKADQIRQAYAQPAARARIDQDAAAERDRASGCSTASFWPIGQKLADASEGVAAGEVALQSLADDLAGLISLDRRSNAALIREMLPAYLASRARGR